MLRKYKLIGTMLLVISSGCHATNSIASIAGETVENRCGLTFPNKEILDSEGGDFDPQIYNCNDYEALLQKVVKKILMQ